MVVVVVVEAGWWDCCGCSCCWVVGVFQSGQLAGSTAPSFHDLTDPR